MTVVVASGPMIVDVTRPTVVEVMLQEELLGCDGTDAYRKIVMSWQSSIRYYRRGRVVRRARVDDPVSLGDSNYTVSLTWSLGPCGWYRHETVLLDLVSDPSEARQDVYDLSRSPP